MLVLAHVAWARGTRHILGISVVRYRGGVGGLCPPRSPLNPVLLPLELWHQYLPPVHPENQYRSLAYAATREVNSCSEPVPGLRSCSVTLLPGCAHDSGLVSLSAVDFLGEMISYILSLIYNTHAMVLILY
jgi:hypothetical protein